jgi:hypothetical protein
MQAPLMSDNPNFMLTRRMKILNAIVVVAVAVVVTQLALCFSGSFLF